MTCSLQSPRLCSSSLSPKISPFRLSYRSLYQPSDNDPNNNPNITMIKLSDLHPPKSDSDSNSEQIVNKQNSNKKNVTDEIFNDPNCKTLKRLILEDPELWNRITPSKQKILFEKYGNI